MIPEWGSTVDGSVAHNVFELVAAMDDHIKAGTLAVDMGGHFGTGKDGNNPIEPRTKQWIADKLGLGLVLHLEPSEAARLLDYWDPLKTSGTILNPVVTFPPSCLFECDICGQPIELNCDGHILQAQPCPHPDGYPPIEFELNCSSGKMVVANDLRRWFKVIGSFDVNKISGQAECTQAYAKIGLAHGFVGNSCPGVYQVGKGQDRFVIGNPAENCDSIMVNRKLATRVASICTDLWWYSICDYDEFIKRAKQLDARNHSTITVKPGVYQFQQVHHRMSMTDKEAYLSRKAHIYCSFDWVREPALPIDLEAHYKSLNFTAEEVIGDHIARWYNDVSPDVGIQKAVDHLMCVIGNGAKHHPNGWVGYTQDVDVSKAVVIPEFKGPHSWYPICGYSVSAEMVGVHDKGQIEIEDVHLNESFVRLAFNIVRSMLVYGIVTRGLGRSPKQEETEKRSQLDWAWRIYEGLKSRYPNQIPENCRKLSKP